MSRKRLFVMGLIAGLVATTVAVIATPPPPAARPPVEPVPFARILAATVQEIAQGVAALHRALPMIAPRLEPIEGILKGLREAIQDRENIELKDVQVELLKLDLHLHRLLFDLERGARQVVEFRDTVKQFVDRFTARMEPRMAQQFRAFAQELLGLVQDRAGERRPAHAAPLTETIAKLKVSVNRLDLLLLRSLEPRSAEE